jgi:hypothetical protein
VAVRLLCFEKCWCCELGVKKDLDLGQLFLKLGKCRRSRVKFFWNDLNRFTELGCLWRFSCLPKIAQSGGNVIVACSQHWERVVCVFKASS